MGTSPVYILGSAVYRMTRPPFIVGGLGMAVGYFSSLLRRNPRYDDPQFRSFLRSYQWACLLKGKKRATAELNMLQASRWNPNE
jgi:hypothetical protein